MSWLTLTPILTAGQTANAEIINAVENSDVVGIERVNTLGADILRKDGEDAYFDSGVRGDWALGIKKINANCPAYRAGVRYFKGHVFPHINWQLGWFDSFVLKVNIFFEGWDFIFITTLRNYGYNIIYDDQWRVDEKKVARAAERAREEFFEFFEPDPLRGISVYFAKEESELPEICGEITSIVEENRLFRLSLFLMFHAMLNAMKGQQIPVVNKPQII